MSINKSCACGRPANHGKSCQRCYRKARRERGLDVATLSSLPIYSPISRRTVEEAVPVRLTLRPEDIYASHTL